MTIRYSCFCFLFFFDEMVVRDEEEGQLVHYKRGEKHGEEWFIKI